MFHLLRLEKVAGYFDITVRTGYMQAVQPLRAQLAKVHHKFIHVIPLTLLRIELFISDRELVYVTHKVYFPNTLLDLFAKLIYDQEGPSVSLLRRIYRLAKIQLLRVRRRDPQPLHVAFLFHAV